MKDIVLSDIHLGSDLCRVDNLLDLLHNLPLDLRRLIINGDLMESPEHRLKKKH